MAGGPSSYDANDMRPAHYNMNITDYHFGAMLQLIKETSLRELDLKRSGLLPSSIGPGVLGSRWCR